ESLDDREGFEAELAGLKAIAAFLREHHKRGLSIRVSALSTSTPIRTMRTAKGASHEQGISPVPGESPAVASRTLAGRQRGRARYRPSRSGVCQCERQSTAWSWGC